MANEKFSDFTAEDDLANYTGLVGFDIGTDNFKITPNEFATHFPMYLNGTIVNIFGGTNTRNFVHWGGNIAGDLNQGSVVRMTEKWILTDFMFKWTTNDVFPTLVPGDAYDMGLYQLNNDGDDASDPSNYTQVGANFISWTDVSQPGVNYPFINTTGLSLTIDPNEYYAIIGFETGSIVGVTAEDPMVSVRLVRDFT